MKKWEDLLVQNQSRRQIRQERISKHLGYDTETLDGKLKLICLSTKNGGKQEELYIEDTSKEENLYSILLFLTNTKYKDYLKWFYNIDYDFRAIIRYLPEELLLELYNENKVKFHNFEIKYLPKKYFSISRNKYVWVYYDISQFFQGGLDKNAKKYLNNECKDDINATVLGSNLQYWKDHKKEIIKYCKQDCKLTAQLADLFYQNLWKEIKFNPSKPYSSGSISQEYFVNNTFIPVIKNIPESVLKLHQDNYRGGRIEILQRGYFDNLKSYDIKSAYPAQMVKLLDYSAGKWKRTTDFDDNFHGIYEIEYNCYDDYIGLFPQNFNNLTVYPNGEGLKTVVNEQELIFLQNNSNIADFKVLNGYQFIPFREIYPYRDLIMQLFHEKESTYDENKRMIYKLFINSIYGKTAQAIYDKKTKKFRTGKLYNPVYSNRITSLTRLELMKNALNISKDVIGFSTDSIQTTKEIKTGSKLGDFTFEYNAKNSVILMSGIRYTDDKQKIRGFGNRLSLDETSETKYNLADVLEMNPEKSKIPVYIKKPVTLFQGLKYSKYSTEDINVFMTSEKILDINGDYRRIWKDNFINCADCLSRNISSIPIMI